MNKNLLLLIALSLSVACFSEGKTDLSSLSDEFDNPETLSQWNRVELQEGYPSRMQEMDIDQTMANCLYLQPGEGVWLEGYQGNFLYKEVKGDFVVTTRLMVQGTQEDFPDPNTHLWQIAGIMLRAAPNFSKPEEERLENWVFNSYGLGISRKHLIDIGSNLNSSYGCFPWGGKPGWVELRVARVDSRLIFLSRNEGEEWVLRKALERADFPNRLQVGMMCNSSGFNPFVDLAGVYSYKEYNHGNVLSETPPDLRVYFDYIRFETVSLTGWQLDDIWQDNQRLLESFR